MNKAFSTYEAAHSYAAQLAATHSRDMGLSKQREFGSTVFVVFMLPAESFRTGRELTCEVVRPGTPVAR